MLAPHRALAALVLLATFPPVIHAQAGDEPRNLQVLTGWNLEEVKQFMKSVSKAMGKRCTFCHEENAYHLDEKEHKKIAREMMRMLRSVNDTYLQGKGTCFMCHQGSPEPRLEP